MVAICQADEFQAMALARSSVGTRFATSDCEAGLRKARAVPKTTRRAKISPTLMVPAAVRARKSAATRPSAAWQMETIARRLKRSEAVPVTRTRRSEGVNCTSPKKDRGEGGG